MFRIMTGSVILMTVLGDLALAQGGLDPRCSGMRDKLGCTCALQNGGFIDQNKQQWWSKRNRNALTNEAFVQCQIRMGRKY
jgi:hypothetical protein